MKVRPHPKFEGIYLIDNKFATVNLVPGYRSANEELITIGGIEYRIWDPWTSKPCAAFKKGLKTFPLKKGFKVLYLGFASGKTGSFFSDIVGRDGIIYAVEISDRVLREAIPMAERRGNIVCLLNDARRPELYEDKILDKIDFLYCDVASPDQVQIVIRNAQKFLKVGSFAVLAIKSQSISSIILPKQVYEDCLKKLEKHFNILDKVELDPYEKDHLFVVMKFK